MLKFLTLEGLKTFWGKIKDRLDDINQSINNLSNVATTGSYNDLIDTPNIPTSVQSDWNLEDDTSNDFIKNKPDLSEILQKNSEDYNLISNKVFNYSVGFKICNFDDNYIFANGGKNYYKSTDAIEVYPQHCLKIYPESTLRSTSNNNIFYTTNMNPSISDLNEFDEEYIYTNPYTDTSVNVYVVKNSDNSSSFFRYKVYQNDNAANIENLLFDKQLYNDIKLTSDSTLGLDNEPYYFVFPKNIPSSLLTFKYGSDTYDILESEDFIKINAESGSSSEIELDPSIDNFYFAYFKSDSFLLSKPFVFLLKEILSIKGEYKNKISTLESRIYTLENGGE